ncbi:hypothetical protein [Saccharopolyspora sp. ASAGF58]|uniref:hypothetical protein n=1 Tax=Saccharopolyspora sp. ASAGF58 TaxID=2719023 RepID=UPI00143FF4E9|nr:hypothetical protein [Saccharopolyspora sp. ASAGF58]QIZ37831.1 hypothetical protein FDZ84_28715 [Saccharopolyspora sp. ASAGF58]
MAEEGTINASDVVCFVGETDENNAGTATHRASGDALVKVKWGHGHPKSGEPYSHEPANNLVVVRTSEQEQRRVWQEGLQRDKNALEAGEKLAAEAAEVWTDWANRLRGLLDELDGARVLPPMPYRNLPSGAKPVVSPAGDDSMDVTWARPLMGVDLTGLRADLPSLLRDASALAFQYEQEEGRCEHEIERLDDQ